MRQSSPALASVSFSLSTQSMRHEDHGTPSARLGRMIILVTRVCSDRPRMDQEEVWPAWVYCTRQKGARYMAEPEQITAIATNIHRRLFDDIEFSKRQQWVITNYVILVYAGMFYLAGYFKEHADCAKILLSLLAFVAGAYAAFLLSKMQSDMGRYREKLESAHKAWLTADEKATTEYGDRPALRVGEHLIGLLGVDLVGLILLLSVLWFGKSLERSLWPLVVSC
jgi:hypothetical protein